eukprot:TRINITY_DN16038_c0_g1_i1.p1 TRINITY_DN16038_c0_g1~~TRINITY_DN16038_c0_g1_i1.p1  ORF type:complete len:387 (+),score=82.92 TRINITY_DN16038_c0_g1_i1:244-1404(+)
MAYNEVQLFVVELVGTALSVLFGLGAVANALLPGTKGHGFGVMGIALCFGFGVFVAVQAVGHVSGLLNPAITFGVAVAGRITWNRAGIAICAQFIGAFLAALITWVVYLPHFQPLTGCVQESPSDEMLAQEHPQTPRRKKVHVFQEMTSKARRYASSGRAPSTRDVLRHESEGDVLKGVHIHSGKHTWHVFQCLHDCIKARPEKSGAIEDLEMTSKPGMPTVKLDLDATVARKQRIKLDERIREDQEVKLVVFATRPSTLEPFHWTALLAEAVMTFVLTYGALAIIDREVVFGANEVAKTAYKAQVPYLIGVLVWAVILAGGGVTGPALNPARDLSPRIAHFLLPIPGKGSSEWHYAWVPVIGPVIGATLGALFANAMKKLHESGL